MASSNSQNPHRLSSANKSLNDFWTEEMEDKFMNIMGSDNFIKAIWDIPKQDVHIHFPKNMSKARPGLYFNDVKEHWFVKGKDGKWWDSWTAELQRPGVHGFCSQWAAAYFKGVRFGQPLQYEQNNRDLCDEISRRILMCVNTRKRITFLNIALNFYQITVDELLKILDLLKKPYFEHQWLNTQPTYL